MKKIDLDRAFEPTPEYVRAAIELGFKEGERKMKFRHKLAGAVSVAAALAIVTTTSLALRGAAPQPDLRAGESMQPTTANTAAADVQWWTADEYARWLEAEKAELQAMFGARTYTASRGWFTWTQADIDEAIRGYEEILEDIRGGMMISKPIETDGDAVIFFSGVDATDEEAAARANAQIAEDYVVHAQTPEAGATIEAAAEDVELIATDACNIQATEENSECTVAAVAEVTAEGNMAETSFQEDFANSGWGFELRDDEWSFNGRPIAGFKDGGHIYTNSEGEVFVVVLRDSNENITAVQEVSRDDFQARMRDGFVVPVMVYSTDQGRYYHADAACSGMSGAKQRTQESAVALGQTACPLCIGAAPIPEEENG